MNSSDEFDLGIEKAEEFLESLKQQILCAIDSGDTSAAAKLCATWYALEKGHSPPPSKNTDTDLIAVLGGIEKVEELLQEQLRTAFEKRDVAAVAAGQRLSVQLKLYKAGNAG